MLEIRNFWPADGDSNIPLFANLQFKLVGLEGDAIDADTLLIEVETISVIDGETASATYDNTSDYLQISTNSDDTYMDIVLDLPIGFEYGQSVTVRVNVDNTDGEPMDEYEISFTTTYIDVISEFKCIFMDYADRIPVSHEILRPIDSSQSPTTFSSAFQNWKEKPAPIIEVDDVITTSGYRIDYENGKIIFSSTKTHMTNVLASYRFSLLSDAKVQGFLNQATAIYTVSPPFGGPSSIYNANFAVRNILMLGASMFALQDILQSIAFQETAVIFDNKSWGDWNRAKDALEKQYEQRKAIWEAIIEAKKAQLPNIHSVVSSDFSLPGGRSRMFRYIFSAGGAS